MSWSSDIRCLYCDGKLPLLRKITSGQFCSAAHRKQYWQEQERLGVERLLQTHDSLRAVRPVEGAAAILGYPMPQAPPPPSGIIAPVIAGPDQDAPGMIAADPFSYEAELAPQSPLWAPQIVAEQEEEAPAAVAGFMAVDGRPQPHWPTDRLAIPEPNPLSAAGPIWIPLRSTAALMKDVLRAGVATMLIAPRHYRGTREPEPVHPAMLPTRGVTRTASPAGDALHGTPASDDPPRAENLLALANFAAQENGGVFNRRDPWPAAPFAQAHQPLLPMVTKERMLSAAPSQPGLRSLSIDYVPLVHGTWIDSLRALSAEGESPRYELAIPALRPRLRLAAGSRYPVATRNLGTAVATVEPENVQPTAASVSIPDRSAISTSASGEATPGKAGLVRIPVKANAPSVGLPPSALTLILPEPLETKPMHPALDLEPLDGKPIADYMDGAPTLAETKSNLGDRVEVVAPSNQAATLGVAWMHVASFWQHAPRDLKLLVFGIPILLALALHPSLKKIPYAAPPQAHRAERKLEHNFQSKLNDQWLAVKQTLVDRAAIALDEDFRAGLDDWTSRGGTTEWAFDGTGFVHPGPLALYRPSVDLTDYQLQFLGMIDKKAMSWVVRAADFDDYYVVKLVVLKPGPVPTVGVTRYAVIHGVAQNRADATAYINAREDMLYRVHMDIHGDTFTLTVQGQLIDSWTEPRLRKGGVGFFSARGEASRLRWVQVTHQYDMLGRLCAYLAPYNIPSTNGGWQP